MFKYARSLLDKGIVKEENLALEDRFEAPSPPPPLEIDEPETIIGENVTLKGTLSFQKMIQIDGTFEGELESKGKLIVGPRGVVKAHLNLEEAFIAGKVEGDITVKHRLVLRGRAEVRGNITAPILSVDEGVSIIGQVYVTAPDSLPDDDL